MYEPCPICGNTLRFELAYSCGSPVVHWFCDICNYDSWNEQTTVTTNISIDFNGSRTTDMAVQVQKWQKQATQSFCGGCSMPCEHANDSRVKCYYSEIVHEKGADMTKGEAKKEIEKVFEPAFANYIIMALEQSDVLDKIVAEVNQLGCDIAFIYRDRDVAEIKHTIYREDVLDIIDKYRKEQE